MCYMQVPLQIILKDNPKDFERLHSCNCCPIDDYWLELRLIMGESHYHLLGFGLIEFQVICS